MSTSRCLGFIRAPGRTGGRIPFSLRPKEMPLFIEQQFFAVGHLMGLKILMLPFSEACEIGGRLENVTLGSP